MPLSWNSSRLSSVGWTLVGLAACACAAAPQPSAKPVSVAAMCLQPKGVTANDADLITDAIVARLQQTGNFRVLERAQMDQILKEQGLSQSGICNGPECAVEVGKILSVDRMMVGSVGLLGKTYTLNLRMVSVTTGEVVQSSLHSRAGTIDDVLTQLVPESVSDLTRLDARDRSASTAGVAGPAESGSARSGASGGRSRWGWWVGGGAVLAGGAAAAILLTRSSSSSGTPPAPSTTTLTTTW